MYFSFQQRKKKSYCSYSRVLHSSSKCQHFTFDPSSPLLFFVLLPFRYPRQPGGERAPAHGHDWPAEQPEGAAPGGARGAEEAGRLTDGEAEAADGAGQAAAGPGRGARCMRRASFGSGPYSDGPVLPESPPCQIIRSNLEQKTFTELGSYLQCDISAV